MRGTASLKAGACRRNKKGRPTISRPVRDRFHIQEGDSLLFEVKDDVLIPRRACPGTSRDML
jgi:bifunctional DNA-binding transcriptional regulator/antitoxin component of YhaV-PrlF toxin-antitoxin module